MKNYRVLILILVEVALGVIDTFTNNSGAKIGLNPYFSGSCSWSPTNYNSRIDHCCLNPYFSGSCSWSVNMATSILQRHCLNPYFSGSCSWSCRLRLLNLLLNRS